MVDIPEMVFPSRESTIVFVVIIAYVAIAFVLGLMQAGTKDEPATVRRKWAIFAVAAISAWLTLNAILPLSRILETEMLPPPPLIFFGFCFLFAIVVAFSGIGNRLSSLPFEALVGFHAFRLPLELVLHNWYEAGTIPVQMTYEGHNFDIVTAILAIILGIWCMSGSVPKIAIWIFNLIGFGFLMAVIVIAVTSSPVPFRQYLNDPPVLLVFHFPYSWIVSIVVTGALTAHLILFRKLATRPPVAQ